MKEEPLLAQDATPTAPSRYTSACVNLVATTVGTGVLSIPISFSYTGLIPGLTILCFFAFLSDASMRFIASASTQMHASSYADLGERVYGRTGRQLVLWSLLALLVGAVVQILICIVDLVEMLSVKAVGIDVSREEVTAIITLGVMPLCMPKQLHSLRFLSSASVLAILFTAGCIIGLAVRESLAAQNGDLLPAENDAFAVVLPPSARWSLAMPIHALAFCSQFNINDLQNELPPLERPMLPAVVHTAMGVACAIYALVGATGYMLLGARTAPNILTAFGDSQLVLAGSAAIALVNLLKLPLVVLPLRSLLLDLCAVPPLSTPAHVGVTAVGVALAGCAADATRDLAFAFQVSGCTAGVMVCFCLPGALYAGGFKLERQRSSLLLMAETSESKRLLAPFGSVTPEELAGFGMLAIGATSGAICLASLVPH